MTAQPLTLALRALDTILLGKAEALRVPSERR